MEVKIDTNPDELPYVCECGELICNPKEKEEHKCPEERSKEK